MGAGIRPIRVPVYGKELSLSGKVRIRLSGAPALRWTFLLACCPNDGLNPRCPPARATGLQDSFPLISKIRCGSFRISRLGGDYSPLACTLSRL